MTVVARPREQPHARASEGAASRVARRVLVYTLMSVLALLTLFPFLWMLSTSFKDNRLVLTLPPQVIPNPFVPQNYVEVFTTVPFATFLVNSVLVNLAVLVLRLAACAMAGYAFARLRAPGRDVIFGVLLAALMVPGALSIIPLYLLYQQLGWLDTYLAIIVRPALAATFGTFLMRQFFLTLPRELEEAALIDGANHVQIFWHVMLPLTKPALAALAIFTFTSTWNSFLEPLIYLKSLDKLTVPVGLAFFGQGGAARSTAVAPPSYNLIMAGSVIAIIPTLIVFFLFQRHFTQGIALTGLKG